MSNILEKLGVPMFGSSEEDEAVLDVLRAFDDRTLSESGMRSASKNQLINSLRNQKAISNRLGRIGLAFYIAWKQRHEIEPLELVKIARMSSRQYDPKYLV